MARKNDILSIYTKEVEQIKADGLFKGEAPFVSPQGAKVVMEDGRELLNMCANNYLGLGERIWGCFCQIYLRNTGHPQKTGKEDFRISGNR